MKTKEELIKSIMENERFLKSIDDITDPEERKKVEAIALSVAEKISESLQPLISITDEVKEELRKLVATRQ